MCACMLSTHCLSFEVLLKVLLPSLFKLPLELNPVVSNVVLLLPHLHQLGGNALLLLALTQHASHQELLTTTLLQRGGR